MKIKKILYSDFVEINIPFIPKYFAKYNSILEDIKSLYYHHILRRRNEYNFNNFGLLISSSTICNANCVFCAKRYLKDKCSIMSFELFKKVIDEYVELGGKNVGMTPTIGDGLIDPNFTEKIKYLKSKNLYCLFYTNAILLDNHLDDLEVDEIYFDIADIIPEYDSQVFQIPLEVSKKRLDSIIKFLNKKPNTKVTLAFRSMRSPKEIVKDMKNTKFWSFYKKKLLLLSFLQAFDNWGGLITQDNLLGIQTLKRAPKIKKYPCESLFNISILPNGNVRLCGCRCLTTMNDELVVGNINKDSLKDIIKSKRLKDIITNFKNNTPEVCRDCSFYRPKVK